MEKETIIKTIAKELNACKNLILEKFSKGSEASEYFDLVYLGEDFEETIKTEKDLEKFLANNLFVKHCIYYPFEVVQKKNLKISLNFIEDIHINVTNSIIYNKANYLIIDKFSKDLIRKLINKSTRNRNIPDLGTFRTGTSRSGNTENTSIGIPDTDWFSYYITSDLENILCRNEHFIKDKDVILVNINSTKLLEQNSFLFQLLNNGVYKDGHHFYGETPTTLTFNTEKVESSDYHNKYRELSKKLSAIISNFEDIQSEIIKHNQEVLNIKLLDQPNRDYPKSRLDYLFKSLLNNKGSDKDAKVTTQPIYTNWNIPIEPLRGFYTNNRPSNLVQPVQDLNIGSTIPSAPANNFNININNTNLTTRIINFTEGLFSELFSDPVFQARTNNHGIYLDRFSNITRSNPLRIISQLWKLKVYLTMRNTPSSTVTDITLTTQISQNEYDTFITVINMYLESIDVINLDSYRTFIDFLTSRDVRELEFDHLLVTVGNNIISDTVRRIELDDDVPRTTLP